MTGVPLFPGSVRLRSFHLNISFMAQGTVVFEPGSYLKLVVTKPRQICICKNTLSFPEGELIGLERGRGSSTLSTTLVHLQIVDSFDYVYMQC